MAARKRPATKSGRPRQRRGVKLKPTSLGPADLRLVDLSPEVAELSRAIEADGGAVLAFDEAVTAAVGRLKERGFDSPYLRNFVVARVNPLRFMKGDLPGFDELFAQMTRRASGMDPARIKSEDVARSGGAADGD